MVSGSEIALALAGGLAVSEATGVTNIVGGGGQSQLPPGLQALLAARSAGQRTERIIERVNPGGGADRVTNVLGGLSDGRGIDLGGRRSSGSSTSTSSSSRTSSTTSGGGFDLQDLAGSGPIGTSVATAGEGARATGETVDDSRDFIGSTLGDPNNLEQSGGLLGFAFDAGNVAGDAARQTPDIVADVATAPIDAGNQTADAIQQEVEKNPVGRGLQDFGGGVIDTVSDPAGAARDAGSAVSGLFGGGGGGGSNKKSQSKRDRRKQGSGGQSPLIDRTALERL